jgi:hypothetical protein
MFINSTYVHVVVFWIMTTCSGVVGYQCLEGSCCLHLQGQVHGAGKVGRDIRRESKEL